MNAKQAWKALGIEPTADKRAVKRAYAVKLKAMDPDQDPKGFLKLRDALQTATWEAEYLSYQDIPELEEVEDTAGSTPIKPFDPAAAIEDDEAALTSGADMRSEEFIVAEIASQNFDGGRPVQVDISSSQAEDEQDWDDEDYDDDYNYDAPVFAADDPRGPLSALLWDESGKQGDESALIAAAQVLLADPKMEQVDHQAEIEDWLAWTLAQSIPRSDPVIPMVVDYFGWQKKINLVNQNYGLIRCASRADDLACIDRLKQPVHRWYAAFARLSGPAPASLSFADKMMRKKDVAALLESLRTHNPGAEMALDADHVALWDDVITKNAGEAETSGLGCSWYTWLLGIWFAFQILRAFTTSDAPEPVMSPVPPINASERGGNLSKGQDLDQLREQIFEDVRRRQAEKADAAPSAQPQKVGGRLIYSSPLWRSEQAPRVQKWMDDNPEELDAVLRPRIEQGILPDCRKLASASGMSPAELAQCRGAQDRRNHPIILERPPEVTLPPRPSSKTDATDKTDMPPPLAPTGKSRICEEKAFKDSALCAKPDEGLRLPEPTE